MQEIIDFQQAALSALSTFAGKVPAEPEIAEEVDAVTLVSLKEAFGLFPQGSAHSRALPHLLQRGSRRFALEPTKVVYRLSDGSRFFDGSQEHLECLMVLMTSGLIPKPAVVESWAEIGPNGKPRMHHGQPVIRKPRLSGLKLDGFDLSGIHFKNTDFFQATGKNVNFEGSTFENCRINNAKFPGSNFKGAKFVDMAGSRSKQGSLRWIDLRGSDLSFADFSGVDVREANFSGCEANGADFRGANAVATKWYGLQGAPIISEGALHSESKFSFEMRGSLLEDDVVVCHRLPRAMGVSEWEKLPEDQRRRLTTARLVEKSANKEEWVVTKAAEKLRKVG